ncbi:unnamed protein product [Penicillium salamii]|uniref:AB hydrolase-1 domain-containing protein n=1 Tax=Penicillium salamii TaxID=1612424 RepID=A0A9W4IAX2_9EURO|nr:unnamed protein product [Penicillium salamii]CAG8251388.1 unnamed protein product [Penicillium salamii]CAG8266688.1 unnamed protein product [Penicillium salamii]CAG8340932.1 unnamed protein product [Penicillium salamii]CAG8377009.1 unnamed protein product [Penicillium salamii]
MGPPTTKQANLFSGVRVFYREQGNTVNAPTILLLHGFPSSSHQFRNLMPLLATKYRVIAPDLPGFGFTEAPSNFVYTFESLTATVADFLDLLDIQKFTMYIFDYGAPVGLRLALQRPDAIQAIITQNGNAYLEGFGAAWQPLKDFWVSDDSLEDRKRIEDAMLTFEAIKFQYENGTPDVSRVPMKEIQIDLLMDYQNNLPLCSEFQKYFRKSQVPLFAIWGKNDVFFIPAGAEAFKRDLPNAEIKLIDAGHFAVESDTDLIAQDILTFLIEKNLWELDVGMGVM